MFSTRPTLREDEGGMSALSSGSEPSLEEEG